jgi:hypothetical protein
MPKTKRKRGKAKRAAAARGAQGVLDAIRRAKSVNTGEKWRTLHRMESDAMRAAGKLRPQTHPKTAQPRGGKKK